jgi:hypothetical protein
VQLYKILSKNSTISETSFPGVAPGQEERYRKIYHNCIIAEDIVYTYYLYLDTAYLRGVDPTDGKYLLSDRAKALLEMANEAIIVRDFPTYFGAVDEIKNLINTYCRSRKISASYQLEFTVPAGI